MIRVIAAMGGEIERDREAFLAGGEVAAIEGVRIFRRREASVLTNGPRLVDVHGRVGAAQIGRDAGPGVEEVDALQIGLGVGRLHEDAFGREPRFRFALTAGDGGGRECDICKVRYTDHSVVSNSRTIDALSRIMIRMLIADNAASLGETGAFRGGFAGEVVQMADPGELRFNADLIGRDHAIRPVEGAGQQLDHRAVKLAIAERRSAGRAEVAFCQ